jgi:hypothetical protein
MSEGDKTRKIHFDLVVELIEVKLLGVAHIISSLDPSIEKDAVYVWKLIHDTETGQS